MLSTVALCADVEWRDELSARFPTPYLRLVGEWRIILKSQKKDRISATLNFALWTEAKKWEQSKIYFADPQKETRFYIS